MTLTLPLHTALAPFRPLLTTPAAQQHARHLNELLGALHRAGELTGAYDMPETIDHDSLAALVDHLHQWFEQSDETHRSDGPAARMSFIGAHISLIELRAALRRIAMAGLGRNPYEATRKEAA